MSGTPNVSFLNFVDTPAQLNYSRFGEAFVQFDPQTTSPLDITGFRTVSILIGSTQASVVEIFMGKISGATLAQRLNVPLDLPIHTFEVVGPQMNISFSGGQPETTENVQLWVYLKS